MKHIPVCFASPVRFARTSAALLLVSLATPATNLARAQEPDAKPPEPKDRGLKLREPGAFDGYTLFSPLMSRSTFLVDMDGKVVHKWETKFAPGNSDYLLPNGRLLRCARIEDSPTFHGGGIGGRVQELDWDGKVTWDYSIADENRHHHHDIEPLPNGNVLMIVWERKTKDEAIARGRDAAEISEQGLWPDAVFEIEPVRPDGGKVVWEWRVWDHLVQDRDPKKPAYGKLADHPELVDANGGGRSRAPETEEQRKKREEREKQMRALGYVGGADDGADRAPDKASGAGTAAPSGSPGSKPAHPIEDKPASAGKDAPADSVKGKPADPAKNKPTGAGKDAPADSAGDKLVDPAKGKPDGSGSDSPVASPQDGSPAPGGDGNARPGQDGAGAPPRDGQDGRDGPGGPRGPDGDWLHTNSVDYDAENDLVLLSTPRMGEIWIIDHSTTTAEAASHAGGKRGRGGDLLYRWGNPQAYGAGGEKDRRLFGQHDARWISKGMPGAGHVMVFNNGEGRPGGEASSVDEIVLPFDPKTGFARESGAAFGPKETAWSYSAKDFFSSFISGADRLPNGNTLVCSGADGRMFEVTHEGKVVWDYLNPFGGEVRPGPGRGGPPGGGPPGGRDGRGPAPGVDGFGPLPGRDGGVPPPGRDGNAPPPGRDGNGPPPGTDGGGPAPDGGPRGGGPRRNPGRGGPGGPGAGGPSPIALFRATRIAKDHSGLAGRSL